VSPTPDKAAWGFEPRLNQVGDTTLTNDRDDTLTPLGKELSDTLFSVLAAETLSVRPDSFSCYNLKTHMAAHPNPSPRKAGARGFVFVALRRFHVDHHVGQMVVMMADIKSRKNTANHGFLRSC